MGEFLSRMKNWFTPGNEYEDDEEYEEDEVDQEEEKPQKMNNTQPTPLHSTTTTPQANFKVVQANQQVRNPQPARMELLNFTMLSYDMTGEISGYIKNKKPIIVNMEKLAPHEMQRAVDYLTGACYALNGNVEKVTDNIFIFAPEHVNINPDNLKSKSSYSRNN